MASSLGDHIKCRRIELHLTQKQLAERIKVSEDCIRLWENNKANPQIRYLPTINVFLDRSDHLSEDTLAKKINSYRLRHGLSSKKFGRLLGVDASTILSWENEKFKPSQESLLILEKILDNWNL